MNISELIAQLQEIAEEHGDNIEVRLAQQPRWAFEYSMGEPVVVDLADEAREMLNDGDLCDEERAEIEASLAREPSDEKIVYLPEGSQLGYLPGAASNALGWGR